MRNLLIIFLFINCPYLLAQGIINEGNLITITDETTFFANTGFINNGTVINNGSLFISGTWLNNNTYDAGNGTFVLSSTGDQIVNHNAQSFTNLRIVGGGRKLFRANLTIKERLILDDGILEAENNSTLIISEEAIIDGGSPQSYIFGPLQRNGRGDLHFPIGSQTEYLPITLQQVSGDNPQISMKAFSNSYSFSPNETFQKIDSNRYWMLEASDYDGAYIELPLQDNNEFQKIENIVVVSANQENNSTNNLGQFEYSGNLISGTVISKELAVDQFYTLAELPEEEKGTTINVYNVITPNGDGRHDFLNIENIESYPDNTVIIYSRWGNKLFEIKEYNNKDRIFVGIADDGKALITGNYQYVIDKGNGDKRITGFLFIQR